MTAAVLEPETGNQANLDDGQVAEILSKHRPGFLDLVHQGRTSNSGGPLLAALIAGVLDNRFEKYDSSTQTIPLEDMSVDQKLLLLEEQHYRGQALAPDKRVFEDRLRELEARFKKDLALEVSRVRDIETAKIRAEESKKWREKMQVERDALESNFNERLHGLREIERKALEQYTGKVRRLEEEFGQKAKSLNLQTHFAEKEFGVKQTELGLMKTDLDREWQKLHVLEKDLKTRERSVSLQESTFESRVKQEVETYKAMTLREIADKKDSVEAKLRKLDEELRGIEEMRRRMQNMAERNLKLEKEIDYERRVDHRNPRDMKHSQKRRGFVSKRETS
jgi:hypothetical protein